MHHFMLGTTLLATCFAFAARIHAQTFVNGIDITGSKDQHLYNVDVYFDNQGDLHIKALHYEVLEEEHYMPLKDQAKMENIATKDKDELAAPTSALEEPATKSSDPATTQPASKMPEPANNNEAAQSAKEQPAKEKNEQPGDLLPASRTLENTSKQTNNPAEDAPPQNQPP